MAYVFQMTSGLVRMRGISWPSATPNCLGRLVPSLPPSDSINSVMTCVEAPQSSPRSWITNMAENGIWEKSTFLCLSAAAVHRAKGTDLDERLLLLSEHISIPYRWVPSNQILKDIRLIQPVPILSAFDMTDLRFRYTPSSLSDSSKYKYRLLCQVSHIIP